MKKLFNILTRILKAEQIELYLNKDYYEVCTMRHPKLKIIQNKKYLVALMRSDEYKPEKYEIHKSEKRGNFVNVFHISQWAGQVIEINKSDELRQGKVLPEYMSDENAYIDYFKHQLLTGVFKGNRLIAYADIKKQGDVFTVGPFIGHKDFLKEGIMYHLFDYLCTGIDGWIMYDTFLGNTEGLTYFKKKLGFKEYNVRWRK